MPRKYWTQEKIKAIIIVRHNTGKKLNSNYAQMELRSLYAAACVYFGSWRKAIESSGIDYDLVRLPKPHSRCWSKEKIIRIIQRRYQRNFPINSNYMQIRSKKLRRLFQAAVKYFGGWPQALEAAGINPDDIRIIPVTRNWNKESIIAEIKKRKTEGKPINITAMVEQDRGLYNAAKRYFPNPGYKNALIAAGFDPKKESTKIKWPKERIIEEILKLKKLDVPLNQFWLSKHGYAKLLSLAQSRFGSWKRAIRSAGLKYSDIKKSKNRWWTKNRITALIRSLKNKNKPLNSIYIQKNHRRLFAASLNYFGSWGKAVEAAGYSYLEHCKVWSSKAWVRGLTAEEVSSINMQAEQMSRIRHGANERV